MSRLPRLSLCAVLAFGGCSSGAPGTLPAPGGANASAAPLRDLRAGTFKTIYYFVNGSDGENPLGGLLYVGGLFYGTTYAGGEDFYGTVFSVTRSGREHVLHSFAGGSDGADPYATLIDVDGTLYGTTAAGGTGTGCDSNSGCGTVFAITPSGTESVLYSFNGGSDGSNPSAGLVYTGGAFYGTTYSGGTTGCTLHLGCGTVFTITSSGSERVLHRFKNGKDGASPAAPLVALGTLLYGTTTYGGKYDAGTVFSISPSGTERVLHSFGGSSDGTNPLGGLVAIHGALYGTAPSGGSTTNCPAGCGVLYRITTAGSEGVVYAFKGGSDGEYPEAPPIDVRGTLYGTTYHGGTQSNCVLSCGTIFKWTLSTGKEQVLYRFILPSGAGPAAGVIDVDHKLYGTAYYGGQGSFAGNGAVYSFGIK
jgi:uncharacterized repeat protein (TIGR03803 family)